MRNSRLMTFVVLTFLFITGCKSPINKEIDKIKHDWGFVLPLPSNNDSINLLFIQAEKSWYLYRNKEAENLFNKILTIDSTFYQAISFKAFAVEPIDTVMLKKAIKYAENDTSVHKIIFDGDYAYWIKHDTMSAILKFKEAFDKYPNSKTTCWCLGMSYLWAGQIDNSIKYNQKALDLDSHFPRAYEFLGWAYFMKKDYEKAIKNFEISIKYGALDPNIYRLTGYAYKELKNSDKSNMYIQKADSIEKK